MGAFYGSIHVKTDRREAVVDAVESASRERAVKCLVSPVQKGWVGIFPANHGQDDQFGAALARHLAGFVVHVMVHDSDVMAYWLWRDGQLTDSYWSRPGYFNDTDRPTQEAMAGNAEAFRELIGDKADRFAAILRRESNGIAFEEERLGKFGRLLGISNALSSYEYMKEGDAEGRKGWRKFIEIPIDPNVVQKPNNRDKRNAANKERKILENNGLLLMRDERGERNLLHGCAVDGGFVTAWSEGFPRTSTINIYREPWGTSHPSGLGAQPYITAVASNQLHHIIAMAAETGIRVWDVSNENWKPLAEIPESDWVTGLAISPDGSTIVHSSRREIVLTELSTGRALVRIEGQSAQGTAFHPSGKWIACSGSALGLISLDREPHWRHVFVGGKNPTGSFITARLRAAIGKLNPAELERTMRAGIDAAMVRMQKSKLAPADAQGLEKIREQMEQGLRDWKLNVAAIREGRELPVPPQGKEHVLCASFSRDGQWLWCGTSAGLRVFRWDAVPRGTGDSLSNPVWQYVFPGPMEFEGDKNVVAITEEVDAAGIVFGGGNGRLYRLDLVSGDLRELAKLPGLAAVHGLSMSSDGMTLGVLGCWTPQMPAGPKDQRCTWDVWSYPRLRGMFLRNS